MSNIRNYRTGTAELDSTNPRDIARWFVAHGDGTAIFFRTEGERDNHAKRLNTGLANWSENGLGQSGRVHDITRQSGLYHNIKFDEEPAKYEVFQATRSSDRKPRYVIRNTARPAKVYGMAAKATLEDAKKIQQNFASTETLSGKSWTYWEQYMEDASRYYDYRLITEGEPVTDYKQKYEDLARAFAAEAQKRNWCPEWHKFADANGIPKELRTPPKVKLRVTLEVEVDASAAERGTVAAVSDVLLHSNLGGLINNGKVEKL